MEQGAAAWPDKKLEMKSFFGVELLFKQEDLRQSVGIVYDGNGCVMRPTSICEDATGFPSKYWPAELNLLPERNLTGNWQGTSVTMTPDLQVSPPVPAQMEWPVEGNQSFFFPDGISLICPSQESVGAEITIAANWLVTFSYLQQMTVKYDASGALSGVTLELFHLADSAGVS